MFNRYKRNKCNKAISELEKQAKILANDFNKINSWIREHDDTDPNLYELMESISKYGTLCGLYDHYYKKYDAYPLVERASEYVKGYERYGYNDSNGLFIYKATRTTIASENRELGNAARQLENMVDLRKNHELFTDENVKNFFEPIYKYAKEGLFFLENRNGSKLRTKVLAKCGGVYNFIHQEKLKNPNFKYDNKEEFERLQSDFRDYLSVSKHHEFAGRIYEMIEAIDKNYKYSNHKPKRIVYHAKKTFR